MQVICDNENRRLEWSKPIIKWHFVIKSEPNLLLSSSSSSSWFLYYSLKWHSLVVYEMVISFRCISSVYHIPLSHSGLSNGELNYFQHSRVKVFYWDTILWDTIEWMELLSLISIHECNWMLAFQRKEQIGNKHSKNGKKTPLISLKNIITYRYERRRRKLYSILVL